MGTDLSGVKTGDGGLTFGAAVVGGISAGAAVGGAMGAGVGAIPGAAIGAATAATVWGVYAAVDVVSGWFSK